MSTKPAGDPQAIERTNAARFDYLERVALIVNRPGNAPELLREVLRELGEFTGFEVAHVYWTEQDEVALVARPSDVWHLADPERHRPFAEATESLPYIFRPGSGLIGTVLARGEAQWKEDVGAEPGFVRREVARDAGLRGAIAAPVITGERVEGVIELFATRPARPDAGLLRAVRATGHLVGRLVERDRHERRDSSLQRRFRRIFEAAPLALVTMEESGRVQDWNPSAERMFGWSAGEARGQLLAELVIPPELREPHRLALERFLATGKKRVLGKLLELRAIHRDGHEFPIELMITEVREGDRYTFYGFLTDLTKRKQAEELARRQQALLLDAQRIARIGGWEWDIPTDRINWSEVTYEIFGLAPEEFDGTFESYLARIHPGDRERMERVVRMTWETGAPFDIMLRIRRPDGEVRRLHARGEVTLDGDGRPVRMAGTGQDVTEQLLAREREFQLLEERARADALARGNEALQEFVYVASHDLQEPLRTITGYLDLLERRYGEGFEKEALEFLHFARFGSTRMQGLLDDLLRYSRLTTQTIPARPVELAEIVAEVQASLHQAIRESKAKIEVEPLPAVAES